MADLTREQLIAEHEQLANWYRPNRGNSSDPDKERLHTETAKALRALPSATGIGYTDEQIAAAVQAWFGDTGTGTRVNKDFINRMRKALLAALEAQLAEARVEAAQPHATAHGLTMKPEQGES